MAPLEHLCVFNLSIRPLHSTVGTDDFLLFSRCLRTMYQGNNTSSLFRSFCICFYDIALWRHVKATVVSKLKSAYIKCLKMFFNFHKYSSVSDMFLQLGLPSFCTVRHNAEWSFFRCKELSHNMLVRLVAKFCVVV